ncbi:hypothetical protein VNI00_004663 [Paramarasmius palmivorus]|uniref:Uncharacterized protein n=1 Tax=Paramarasmius palmivorus TaxID=297713 RepID=A0AAW0DHA6_9AGAR
MSWDNDDDGDESDTPVPPVKPGRDGSASEWRSYRWRQMLYEEWIEGAAQREAQLRIKAQREQRKRELEHQRQELRKQQFAQRCKIEARERAREEEHRQAERERSSKRRAQLQKDLKKEWYNKHSVQVKDGVLQRRQLRLKKIQALPPSDQQSALKSIRQQQAVYAARYRKKNRATINARERERRRRLRE